jgi:hypothetical protein
VTRDPLADKTVPAHGAATVRLALAARVLDDLELHVTRCCSTEEAVPSRAAPKQIELERTRILDGEAAVTHIHYRVQH